MDILTSETCWALNNEIIKQVTSSWSLFKDSLQWVKRHTSFLTRTLFLGNRKWDANSSQKHRQVSSTCTRSIMPHLAHKLAGDCRQRNGTHSVDATSMPVVVTSERRCPHLIVTWTDDMQSSPVAFCRSKAIYMRRIFLWLQTRTTKWFSGTDTVTYMKLGGIHKEYVVEKRWAK